jgi:uncharacterized protein (DUF1697 family)
MPRFAALLRGVNVGKGNRVLMVEFRRLLEELGYADVRTLLNSGNAVFASAARGGTEHSRAISAALLANFGVSTLVIVKSAAELGAIIKGNPIHLPESEHSRLLVVFGQERGALQALGSLHQLAQAAEQFVITPEAAYLHCPAGLLRSKIGSALLGKDGKAVTTRNWATVQKLGTLLGAT